MTVLSHKVFLSGAFNTINYNLLLDSLEFGNGELNCNDIVHTVYLLKTGVDTEVPQGSI